MHSELIWAWTSLLQHTNQEYFFKKIEHYQEMEKKFMVSKHIGGMIFEHVDGR